jgi:hypothetical protein
LGFTGYYRLLQLIPAYFSIFFCRRAGEGMPLRRAALTLVNSMIDAAELPKIRVAGPQMALISEVTRDWPAVMK